MLPCVPHTGDAPTASLVVLSQLQVEALPVHPNRDSPDAIPGIQVALEGPEGSIIRGQGAPGEAERREEESAARVEHVESSRDDREGASHLAHLNARIATRSASTTARSPASGPAGGHRSSSL
jgi:hypothetical protein